MYGVWCSWYEYEILPLVIMCCAVGLMMDEMKMMNDGWADLDTGVHVQYSKFHPLKVQDIHSSRTPGKRRLKRNGIMPKAKIAITMKFLAKINRNEE